MDEPVILITGALTGIGRAAAVDFAGRRRTRRHWCPQMSNPRNIG